MGGQTQKRKTGKKRLFVKSLGRTILTGLFGGMFWSAIGLICYLLKFSTVGPALLFSFLPSWSWRDALGGQLLAVAGIGLLSIFIAVIYLLAFSKIKSMWFSIGFGIFLWGCVFWLFRPLLGHLPPITKLGWNTLTTTLCLYALYGLFIGYSISFDFEERSANKSYSNQ